MEKLVLNGQDNAVRHLQSNVRIWLITSAETSTMRHYYLNHRQQRFLSKVEKNIMPKFIGADNITSVYLLKADDFTDYFNSDE